MDLTDQLVIPIFICHQYLFLWKHSCLNLVELLHWHGPWSLMPDGWRCRWRCRWTRLVLGVGRLARQFSVH